MSNAENRDAIARAMGWTYKTMAGQSWWDHPEQLDSDTHPIPNTADAALDAFARLLPGCDWYRDHECCGRSRMMGATQEVEKRVMHGDEDVYVKETILVAAVPDTGDFKADLFALIVKALEARKA